MLGFKTAITSAPFSTEYCNGQFGKINKNIWGRRQQNYSFDLNDFVEVQWWVHFSARMITRGQSRACGAAQDNPFCSRTSRRLLWSALQDVLGRICSYHFTPVLCRIFSFKVTIVGHFSPLQESIVGSFSSVLHVHCTLCQGLYFSPIQDPWLQCYEGYLCSIIMDLSQKRI